MSISQSPNETRKQYVFRMGEPLGEASYHLCSQVAFLFRDWGEFVYLFGGHPDRTELLNKTAPIFFRAVQFALFDATVLGIARLTDPPKSVGKSNLTVQQLPDLADTAIKDELTRLIEEARGAAEFCRVWRNRWIAHRDLPLGLGKNAAPLPDATIGKVKEVIVALGVILNLLTKHYLNSTTLFDFDARPGGAPSLLKVLQDGMKLKAE
jgi:HEPN superfamily AbiU2-like protein